MSKNLSDSPFIFMNIFTDLIYSIDTLIRLCNNNNGFCNGGRNRSFGQLSKSQILIKCVDVIAFDVIPLVPTEFICYICAVKHKPFFRINRCTRIYHIWRVTVSLREQSGNPYAIYLLYNCLITFLLLHWNGYLYYLIKISHELRDDNLSFNYQVYLKAFIWSTIVLTNIGETEKPTNKEEMILLILGYMIALLIMAALISNFGEIISTMDAKRTMYFKQLRVCDNLLRSIFNNTKRTKILNCLKYNWAYRNVLLNNPVHSKQSPQQLMNCLSPALQKELCMSLHLKYLLDNDMFKSNELGFLTSVVSHLTPVLFGTGDLICQVNEVGRHMYVVRRGCLKVSDDLESSKVLTKGAVFGEISLLNLFGNSRRTVTIRSIGFSELLVLDKSDLLNCLSVYPSAKRMLSQVALQLLLKDKLITDQEAFNKENIRYKYFCKVESILQRLLTIETRIARSVAEHKTAILQIKKRIKVLKEEIFFIT